MDGSLYGFIKSGGHFRAGGRVCLLGSGALAPRTSERTPSATTLDSLALRLFSGRDEFVYALDHLKVIVDTHDFENVADFLRGFHQNKIAVFLS